MEINLKKEPFLYAGAFLMDGCFAVVGLCIPLVALQLGATYDDLGLISATGALVYAMTCLLSGRLADRFGYRRSMTMACLMMMAVFLVYLFVDRVWHLVVLGALTGLAIANFWPPLQAWLGQGKDRQSLLRALGGFNVAWSLGFLVGPALGGAMFEAQPQSVFVLGAVLACLLSIALRFVHIEDPVAVSHPNVAMDASRDSGSFLAMAWLANFSTFFVVGTVRALFPKLATDLGIAPGFLGRLMALIALAQLTAFYCMARTDRWQFRLGPIVVIQGLAVLGLMALAFGTTAAVFAVGLLMVGGLAGVTFTASIFYSLHTAGPGGRRTGFHEAIVGSGFLFGPLAGGTVAEYLGARAPYWLAAGVILSVMVGQVLMRQARSVRGLTAQAGD